MNAHEFVSVIELMNSLKESINLIEGNNYFAKNISSIIKDLEKMTAIDLLTCLASCGIRFYCPTELYIKKDSKYEDEEDSNEQYCQNNIIS